MSVLLISPDRLISETILNDSIDNAVIAPVIKQAQDKYIWELLGTKLYEKIKADAADGTITGDYETLLDTYIQPALVQFAFAELLPLIRVRVVNHSVTIMSSEQSDAAAYEDIRPIINRAKDMGEFYRERMVDFLCDRSASIPEYKGTQDDGGMYPTHNSYTQGLYLGDSRERDIKDTLRTYGII